MWSEDIYFMIIITLNLGNLLCGSAYSNFSFCICFVGISWPLNNMRLNCTDPFICRFYLMNTVSVFSLSYYLLNNIFKAIVLFCTFFFNVQVFYSDIIQVTNLIFSWAMAKILLKPSTECNIRLLQFNYLPIL